MSGLKKERMEITPNHILEQTKLLEAAVNRIKDKKHKILFLVPDSKGNPRHNIITIYKHVKALRDAGYDACIFTEKKDYHGVSDWLGSSYAKIPHYSVEEQKVKVSYSDFLIAPEVFGAFIEQGQDLPVNRVVFVHEHEYMLEAYSPAKTWLDYKTFDTMATTEAVANYVKETIGIENVKITPEFVGKHFKPSTKPKKPSIALYTRNPRKALKFIKMFYIKYPSYRFINFKHVAKINHNSLADQLRECMASVWIDQESSFGAFGVESIKSNVPVIGLLPSLIPEWASDDNGIWTTDENQLVDLTANFIGGWLTGRLPDELKNVSQTLEGQYEEEKVIPEIVKVYEQLFQEKSKTLEDAIAEGHKQIKLMTETKIKEVKEIENV